MKRYLKAITALTLVGMMGLGLAACTSGSSARNPYDVATGIGYDGSRADWLADNTSPATEARRMYQEAVADGYTGSYVEFLKEIGGETDRSAALSRAMMSTVAVTSNFERRVQSSNSIFGSKEEYSSLGAGIIYSLNRVTGTAYIVTNYHVLYSSNSLGKEKIPHMSDDIDVYLYGGMVESRALSASYVGGAMDYDIAVLKVENSAILKDSSALPVTTGDSDALLVGEDVYAIGNPNGEGLSVTRGVVSVDAEYINIEVADGSRSASMLEIRTDAPINHGNSGGGLYDADGRLIGIVNARSENTGVMNFGYAIPSNLALAVAQNIIDNSRTNNSKGAMRAMLGITVKVADSQSVYDEKTNRTFILETVTVQETTFGGMAFGKLHIDDVLYSVRIGDSEPLHITRMHLLTNALFHVRRGDTVTLVVARGDEMVTVEFEFNRNSDFVLYD